MNKEEKMIGACKYIKEQVPSITYQFINTVKDIYKPMATKVNKCAINQRNWRMYRVDLGGNGRHRNIRKAIHLMANRSRYSKSYIVISDISDVVKMSVKRETTVVLNNIVDQWKHTRIQKV